MTVANLARNAALRIPKIRALYEHAQHLGEERERLAGELAQLWRDLEDARRELSGRAAEIEDLRAEHEQRKSEIAELHSAHASTEEGLAATRASFEAEIGTLRARAVDLERRLAIAVSDKQRATLLNQKLLEESRLRNDASSQNGDFEAARRLISDLQAELSDVRKEMRSSEQRSREELEETRSAAEVDRAELLRGRAEIESQLSLLGSTLAEAQGALESEQVAAAQYRLQAVARIADLEQRLALANSRAQRTTALNDELISEANTNSERIAAVRAEAQLGQSRMAELEAKLLSAQAERSDWEGRARVFSQEAHTAREQCEELSEQVSRLQVEISCRVDELVEVRRALGSEQAAAAEYRLQVVAEMVDLERRLALADNRAQQSSAANDVLTTEAKILIDDLSAAQADAESHHARIAELEADLLSAQDERNNLESQTRVFIAEAQEVREQLREVTEQVLQVQAEKAEVLFDLERLVSESDDKAAQAATLEGQIQRLVSEIDEARRQVSDLEVALAQAKTDTDTAQTEASEATQRVVAADQERYRLLERLSAVEQDVQSSEQFVAGLRAQMEADASERGELQLRLNAAELQARELQHKLELAQIRESIAVERGDAASTEATRLRQIEGRYQEAQGVVAELRARLAVSDVELMSLREQAQRLQQSRAELDDLRIEAAVLRSEADRLATFEQQAIAGREEVAVLKSQLATAQTRAEHARHSEEALSDARAAAIRLAERVGAAEAAKVERDEARRQAVALSRRLGAAEARLNQTIPDAEPITGPSAIEAYPVAGTANYRRILLLSDIPPCSNYTGGIALAQQCREMSPGELAAFVVLDRSLNPALYPDLSWLPLRTVAKPREGWSLAEQEGGVASEEEAYNAAVTVRELIDQAVGYGREQGVDAVWVVLEGQTVTRMAVPVAKALGVPLYTQVWDPISWWLDAHGVDPVSKEKVQAAFDDAILASEGVATASWSMADHYRERYGVEATPVIYAQPTSAVCSPAPRIRRPDHITIGLVGQFYADDAWGSFRSALESEDWRVAGRRVRLFYAGSSAPADIDAELLENAGWLKPDEAIAALSARADVMYCPYPFGSKMREVAELSFPSKLVMFAASGRPTLCHAPWYSSAARFVSETGMGLVADSIDGREVLSLLEVFCSDQDLYADACRSARRAFLNHFTRETQRDNFFRFLRRGAVTNRGEAADGHGHLGGQVSG